MGRPFRALRSGPQTRLRRGRHRRRHRRADLRQPPGTRGAARPVDRAALHGRRLLQHVPAQRLHLRRRHPLLSPARQPADDDRPAPAGPRHHHRLGQDGPGRQFPFPGRLPLRRARRLRYAIWRSSRRRSQTKRARSTTSSPSCARPICSACCTTSVAAIPAQLDAVSRPHRAQALDRYFRHPKLKLLLTADCPHWGSPPARTSFVFDSMLRLSYFLGNYYPRGGSQAFADELAQRFEEQGGHILMHALVTRILVQHETAYGVEVETRPRA